MENEIAFAEMLGKSAKLSEQTVDGVTKLAIEDTDFVAAAQHAYGNDVEFVLPNQKQRKGTESHTKLFLNDTGCVYHIQRG